MKAVVVDKPKQLCLSEIEPPALPVGGALIDVLACGVCGSDMDKLYYRESIEGLVLGHEVMGRIRTLSEEAKRQFPHLREGQRVSVAHHAECQQCYYCLHQSPSMCRTFKSSNIVPGGFSQQIAVTHAHLAATVFPLPQHISDVEGTCLEPLACCVRAVDRLPSGGESMLVIGLGFIGLLTAQYAKYQGYRVYGVDLQQARVDLALQHAMVDDAATDYGFVQESARLYTENRGVDVVFLTAVTPKTLEMALDMVRDGGTLLLFASYADNLPVLDQNQLYFREIAVMTSYSPSSEHLKKAHHLLTEGHIGVSPLLSHTVPLEALPEAMALYHQGQAMKVIVTV